MAKAGLKEDRLKKFDSQDPVEGDTIIRIKANNNSKYHDRANDVQGTAMSSLDRLTHAMFTSPWIGSVMVPVLQGRTLKPGEAPHNLPKTTWLVGPGAAM